MNIGSQTMKAFNGVDEYEDRIVAFVDVMGMKNKISSAKKPKDFKMYSTILNSFANQPFAVGKIRAVMFSDCMYLVTKKEYIDYIINLLANFAYTMLYSDIPTIRINEDGTHTTIHNFDCFKLRGGITYGKVFMLDEAAEINNIPLNSNILFGQAVMDAYTLESQKAVYPRIIADDNFIKLANNMGKELSKYHLVKENENDYFYIDFLGYMLNGKKFNDIAERIDFIKDELNTAMKANNAKLAGQLLWYVRYLEKYCI